MTWDGIIFRGLELVGWLNETESLGWGFIRGRIHRGYLVNVTSRIGKLPVTFQLITGKSSIKFNLKDGEATANVTIKVRAELAQWGANVDLLNPGIIKSLETDLAEAVKSNAMASLKKAQRELNSDVFGFGFQLNRQDHREWNRYFKTGTVIKRIILNP